MEQGVQIFFFIFLFYFIIFINYIIPCYTLFYSENSRISYMLFYL